jgi:hypothetical protein
MCFGGVAFSFEASTRVHNGEERASLVDLDHSDSSSHVYRAKIPEPLKAHVLHFYLLQSCSPLLVSPVVNVLFPGPHHKSGIYFNGATERRLDGYGGSRNNSDVEFNRPNGVAPQGGQYSSTTVSEETYLSTDPNPSLSVQS